MNSLGTNRACRDRVEPALLRMNGNWPDHEGMLNVSLLLAGLVNVTARGKGAIEALVIDSPDILPIQWHEGSS